MDFNRARDSLHQDPGPSFAQTLTRTMSAPTVMSVPGGNPLPLMMAGHLLPHAFGGLGISGAPLVSRDELQTMLLNASQPQWTPASEEDIGDLPVVSIEARHLANTDTKLCSVCQEDFTLGERATLLTCNHLFHQKCITPWLEKNRTCPLCRKEVVNVRWEQLQHHGQRALRQPPAPSASARCATTLRCPHCTALFSCPPGGAPRATTGHLGTISHPTPTVCRPTLIPSKWGEGTRWFRPCGRTECTGCRWRSIPPTRSMRMAPNTFLDSPAVRSPCTAPAATPAPGATPTDPVSSLDPVFVYVRRPPSCTLCRPFNR